MKYWILIPLIAIAILLRVAAPSSSCDYCASYTNSALVNSNFAEASLHSVLTIIFAVPFLPDLIKVLLVTLAAIGVFLFTRELTKSDNAGYLAVLLYSVAQAAIYFEAFDYWSGEGITPILMLWAIFLLLHGFRSKKPYLLAFSLCLVLFSVWLWQGGLYWLVLYVFAIFSYMKKGFLLLIIPLSFVGFFALGLYDKVYEGYSLIWNTLAILSLSVGFSGKLSLFYQIALASISKLLYGIPALVGVASLKRNKAYFMLMAIILASLPFLIFGGAWWLSLSYLAIIPLSAAVLYRFIEALILPSFVRAPSLASAHPQPPQAA